MELTATFSSEQYDGALESWGWLELGGKSPLFSSLFGDVFFESPDGYWCLDHLEGTLTRRWSSSDAMRDELGTDQGQDAFLLGGLATAADSAGLALGPSEIYSFRVPPVLGGPMTVEAIEKIDFVVGMDILGQIHDQVRTLPPGTPISGITVDGEKP